MVKDIFKTTLEIFLEALQLSKGAGGYIYGSITELLLKDEIDAMIQERLGYLMSKIKVLETHFVSGTSGSSERTQATPRKDAFNLISIDIILRYHEHKFVFANPKLLESSGGNEDHLQQNYIMGFVFINKNGASELNFSDEWFEDFNKAYETINEDDAIQESDMQKDLRVFIAEGDE